MTDRLPAIVSPYDAELFGHWWFEGPDFLYNMFKEIAKNNVIKAITPVQYLSMYPQNQEATPHSSSWGDKGYFDVWLNHSNDWIYRHLHEMQRDTLIAQTSSRIEF
jgi:1,4-alpha-glucan branching enzyme